MANSYEIIRTVKDFNVLKKRLTNSTPYTQISIDVETSGEGKDDGLNPWKGYLVGVGFGIRDYPFATQDISAYYLPMVCNHPAYVGLLWDNDRLRELLDAMPPEPTWLMHNAKFDLEWLELATGYRFAIDKGRDPMIEMWLARADEPKGLKDLTKKFFPHEPEPVEFKTLLGKGKNKIKIEEVDLDTLASYCMADCVNTIRIGDHTFELLHAEGPTMMDLYRQIEMPMLRLLADMELRGVQLDSAALDKMAIEVTERLEQANEELQNFADINWNSTAQVTKALQAAGVTLPPSYTPTGKQKLDGPVLQAIRDQHEIVETLLEQRGLEKVLDYIEAFYERSDDNMRIHCQFRQAGTRTGRLSCGDPNLQNIPSRDKPGVPEEVAKFYGRLRTLFVGNPDLLVADLSQIEFRFAAHYSKDPVLVKAYLNGHDFHKATAEAVTGGDRRLAKNINFGYLYGQRGKGLSELTGMPLREANKFYSGFEKSFRGLYMWDIKAKAHARAKGYAETIMGRRRHLPDITSEKWGLKSAAERQAISTMIQGSAADYLKIAMLRIARRLEAFDAYIVLQVHDELVIDAGHDLNVHERDAISNIVKQEMENAIKLLVPVKTEPVWVKNWAEAK